MGAIPGTVGLTGIIAPKDELDTYPVQEDIWGKGGFRVADDLAMRDAIEPLRRKIGMPVYVISEDVTYKLTGGIENANWSVYSPGGGGTGVDDKNYVHVQGEANTVWEITHNLGKYPSVTVIDSASNVVEGDVEYLNTNIVRITFSAAFSGSVTLN